MDFSLHTNSSTPFRLFDLAPEIRNLVYFHLFYGEDIAALKFTHIVDHNVEFRKFLLPEFRSLLWFGHTCQQARQETRPIFIERVRAASTIQWVIRSRDNARFFRATVNHLEEIGVSKIDLTMPYSSQASCEAVFDGVKRLLDAGWHMSVFAWYRSDFIEFKAVRRRDQERNAVADQHPGHSGPFEEELTVLLSDQEYNGLIDPLAH
jgi:hypothetical protein